MTLQFSLLRVDKDFKNCIFYSFMSRIVNAYRQRFASVKSRKIVHFRTVEIDRGDFGFFG